MANANVYFENVNGHTEIRYRTEGVAPVFAEKWFQKIQAEHDKQQARFTKAHRVMDLTPLVTDNDIPDAVAAEIINEQLEAAAVAEQDAAYTAEIAAKCAAISAQGLQIVSELRVGDRLYSWHKAWCDDAPKMHFHGVVMTPPDEYGRLITNFYGVYNLAPSIVNLNNWQAPYYVERSAYQWSSANTRYTVDLMEQMTPAQETEFWRTFNTRLDNVIDALAPDMLDETERRKLAFVETRNADTRVMAIESEQIIEQEAAA